MVGTRHEDTSPAGTGNAGVALAPKVAEAVRRGLLIAPRSLPPWLFYDAEGSRLYERITELPEYYLTRTEREIFARYGREILDAVRAGAQGPLNVVELGAGSASKSQLLLEALVTQQGPTRYVPVDVSPTALAKAQERLLRELPAVTVEPVVGTYDAAFEGLGALGPRRLVLFIGSSVGNLTDDEAQRLLREVRGALTPGDALLLGTDLRKDPAVLLAAYDDAQGVTAAFNRNVLVRLNRELGADFDLARWRHVALWNDASSRIEMYLESLAPQRVRLAAFGAAVDFVAGERIHTESSVKYDDVHVARLAVPAGWRPEHRWTDAGGRFAAHLLRAI